MAKLHLGDLAIGSPSFEHGSPIPAEHAGDGADVSPELIWRAIPSGKRQLALVCHDPDAPLTYASPTGSSTGSRRIQPGSPKVGGVPSPKARTTSATRATGVRRRHLVTASTTTTSTCMPSYTALDTARGSPVGGGLIHEYEAAA